MVYFDGDSLVRYEGDIEAGDEAGPTDAESSS
jgi:hypothetical protein